MVDINPIVAGAPVAAGLGSLAWFGWPREMKKREARIKDRQLLELARKAQLPEGAVEMSLRGMPTSQADYSGRIMLILDGTFSENVGVDLLTLLDRCHQAGAIGSIYLIELDGRRRERFLAEVPPIFLDRVVTVSAPGLSGGLGNLSPKEVIKLIDHWGAPVLNKSAEVAERHLRLHQGQEPALLLVFVSQGGQAIIGTKAVEAITRQFPLVKAFGFSALPIDDRLRQRVTEVLEAYRKVGVHGFVLADNLQDEVRNDFGMVGAIVGFAAAAENADAGVEQNNAWYLLFDEAPGHLVSYHTYARPIPGYRLLPTHPAVPPRYFVYKDSVVSTILTSLAEVRRPEFHALGGAGVNGKEPLTSRFDIVLAAVVAKDLKSDEDDVVLGQYLKGQDKRNYHLLFAPIKTEIDPSRLMCPIAVVSLQAVHDSPQVLRRLTGLPEPKPPAQLLYLPDGTRWQPQEWDY